MSFTTKTKRDRTAGEKTSLQTNERFAPSLCSDCELTRTLWVCVCFSVDIHWQDCVYECVNVRSSTWMFSSWYSRSVLSVFSRSVWSRASCSPWVRRKMWVFWASICCCSFSCCGGDNSCYIIIWTLWPCSFANSHNWFLHMIAAPQPFSPWCDFANREEKHSLFLAFDLQQRYKCNKKNMQRKHHNISNLYITHRSNNRDQMKCVCENTERTSSSSLCFRSLSLSSFCCRLRAFISSMACFFSRSFNWETDDRKSLL